jgi:4-hydroxy-3-polyprenylbenzoate decarboxylase
MLAVTEHGGIIAPPVPAFYAKPKDLAEMVDHTIARILDLFDLDSGLASRWNGEDRKHTLSREKPASPAVASGVSHQAKGITS